MVSGFCVVVSNVLCVVGASTVMVDDSAWPCVVIVVGDDKIARVCVVVVGPKVV